MVPNEFILNNENSAIKTNLLDEPELDDNNSKVLNDQTNLSNLKSDQTKLELSFNSIHHHSLLQTVNSDQNPLKHRKNKSKKLLETLKFAKKFERKKQRSWTNGESLNNQCTEVI